MARRLAPIVLVTAAAALSSLPGWIQPVLWTPDGFFYEARVQTLRGAEEREAFGSVLRGPLVQEARTYVDGVQLDKLEDPAWVEHTTEITRRRVLVPVLAAAVYPVFGERSLQSVSLLGYVLFAPLLYLLLRRRFSVWPSACVAVGLALFPPLREWSFHPLTDSWGLTLEVAALLAAALVLDRGARWLPFWVAALGTLSLTRDAALVVACAAAWVALRQRTRLAWALAGLGVLAALPAPLLLGAPVGGTVGHAAADAGRYLDNLWAMVRIDVLAETTRPEHLLPGVALVGALVFALTRARARRLVVPLGGAFLAFTLVATAVLATRRVEPTYELPVGLVLIAGVLLLIALPNRGGDPFVRLHRAGAAACAAYLAIYPVPTDFRLELAFLPFLAVGFARALDRPLASPAKQQPASKPAAGPVRPVGVAGARHG